MSHSYEDAIPKPGYAEPYATLLTTLERQTAGWRQQLGEPSIDELVWQPYPNGHSIGALLLHLAEVETYWIESVCSGRALTAEDRQTYLSDHMDPFTGQWPAPPREPFAYYSALLDAVRARTLESVKAFGDPREVKQADWGAMTVRYVLTHVIWHESYHGGQAVLLKSLRAGLNP